MGGMGVGKGGKSGTFDWMYMDAIFQGSNKGWHRLVVEAVRVSGELCGGRTFFPSLPFSLGQFDPIQEVLGFLHPFCEVEHFLPV